MARNDGRAFELEFAVFMLELGWKPAVRDRVKGKTSRRKYECDIHGTRRSILRLLVAATFVGLAIALLGIRISPDFADSLDASSADPDLLTGAVFMTAVVGLVVWQHSRIHVWVECKDRKDSVKRADISKLVASVADAKKHAIAARLIGAWKANQMWFATSSSFDEDALAHAEAAGIRCFGRIAPGRFEEI